MTPPVDLRRRDDFRPTFPTFDPAGVGDVDPSARGADPTDGARPIYLERAAWVEDGSDRGQAVPQGCTIPDPRPLDRIGAGTPSPSPRSRDDDGGSCVVGDDRGIAVGISGVRRRPGLDAMAAADARGLGDTAVAQQLLTRATDRYGNGADGLRVRIGDETLTVGQLRFAAERDPERFADTLRRHGISVAEFNEVLDDALASDVPRGTELDLREGSDLARAYHIGGADGATVDSHYDSPATEARAAEHRDLESRADVRGNDVRGPGFFQMIADAFSELAGLIARAFGSSWNPDTATFDGRVDDARFIERGRQDARGPEGLALQALLSQPDGEARLRRELMAQKPASATERQWSRVVDDYVRGLREGLRTETSAGRLPSLSAEEGGEVALYLRSQNYSAAARADVEHVLAQPQPIRGQALRLLNELPDAERANLTSLFTPRGERPEDDPAAYRTWSARRLMSEGTTDERVAMFETMRRDGFRTAVGSPALDDVLDAVTASRDLPENVRARYLQLVPQLGVERAYLATDYDHGLARLLKERSPDDASTFLADIERRVHSTDDLERGLVGGRFHLELRVPDAGLISTSNRAGILHQLEAHNVTFALRSADGATPLRIVARGEGDANTISLERYFRDDAYRADVLRRTGLDRRAFEGMLTNVSSTLAASGNESGLSRATEDLADARRRLADPTLSEEDRRTALLDERFARLRLREDGGIQNVEIDISAGSQVDQLFGLRQRGVSSGLEASKRVLLDVMPEELTVTLRGPTTSRGRPGPTYTINAADVAELIRNPPAGQTAEEAFRARWPGLDYRETVHALAATLQIVRGGSIEPTEEGGYRIDLTRRGDNEDLNRIGQRLRDGTRRNLTAPSGMGFDVNSRSTADVAAADHVWSTSTVGAAAGNNFYQYGWFQVGGASSDRGYYDTRHAATDARRRFEASGRVQDPAHAMEALFALDGYTRVDGGERQYGTAAGDPAAFLRDPVSGLPARGEDFTVLTFTGSGTADQRTAFARSAQRVEDMFTRYGGVPRSQVERQTNPSPETMYAAIEAEILHDPRAEAERDRARTVVVYYAGHTHSDRSDGVMGMAFRVNGETRYFTPEMVARITELARERGVNLMFVTDACRAGEYSAQPQAELARAAEASGTATPELRSLSSLRDALRTYHRMLTALHNTPAANLHAPMPNGRELERLGRDALRESAAGSGPMIALDVLRARRDAVVNSPDTSDGEKRVMTEYVRAIETMIAERRTLSGVAGMNAIANDGVLTGATAWESNNRFKTQTLGRLEDRLGEAIRARTPAVRPADGASP